MFLYIMLGLGIAWTTTYILIILRTLRDRTYGMPMAALFANISWEFIFSFVLPSHGIQLFVNIVWFTLDAVILITFFVFGPKEFPHLPKGTFWIFSLLGLTIAFCTILFFTLDFHDAGVYSAFLQNLMMSILFIVMLYHRQSIRGQSLGIAISKLIGTLLASLAFYLYQPISQHSTLLPFLYGSILIYDLVYIGLIIQYGQNKLMLSGLNSPQNA